MHRWAVAGHWAVILARGAVVGARAGLVEATVQGWLHGGRRARLWESAASARERGQWGRQGPSLATKRARVLLLLRGDMWGLGGFVQSRAEARSHRGSLLLLIQAQAPWVVGAWLQPANGASGGEGPSLATR